MPKRAKISVLYPLILAFIIVLALGTHSLIDQIESEQDGAAMVINTAGRQRMLSQRIALFAGEFSRTGKPESRENLHEAIYTMQDQHNRLTNPDRGSAFEARLTAPLRTLYEEEGLNHEVELFLSSAKQIASDQSEDVAQHLNILMGLASNSMLQKLDDAVAIYQTDSENELTNMHRVENGTFAILMLSLLVEALLIFRPLLQLNHRLHAMAMTDELTGLPNRRYFMNGCQKHLSLSRSEYPTSALLLLDVDNFKAVNDQHGHDAGDIVLQNIARVLRDQARKMDLVGRLGGEEFGVLFTGLTAEQARDASKRLLEKVAQCNSRITSKLTLNVTMSGGLTMLEHGDSLTETLKRADILLYQAKSNGKAHVEDKLYLCPAALPLKNTAKTTHNPVSIQLPEPLKVSV